MPVTRSRRLAGGLALTLALAGVVAACGDDDDAATPSAAACDDLTALSGALAGDPSQAEPVIAAFEASAPEGLADAAKALGGAYRDLASGEGDPSAFGSTKVIKASADIADGYFDGCDLAETLDVDGVDYGFEGLPATIDAGRVGLRFTNRTEHDEPHEMVLFKKSAGVTESAEELLELPEEESMSKVSMQGVVFADQPDQTVVAMYDLEPGQYMAVCFIPVGGGEDGPPHFTSGMVAEFEAS